MQSIMNISLNDNSLKALIINVFAISIIYFVPSISHILNIPLYLFEPMRIMLILSLVHTNKANAYFLALTLPFVSFLFSGHPIFPKVTLIVLELIINVFLFYKLSNVFKNTFWTVSISIIASKVVYYLLKYILISSLLIDSELVSTPIFIQFITTALLAVYAYIIFSYNRTKSNKSLIEN